MLSLLARRCLATTRNTLRIDTRERDLLRVIRGQWSPQDLDCVKVEPLDVGDIVLEINGKRKLTVERKTMGDLSASIKDGRFREQRARMQAVRGQKWYIVEGLLGKTRKKVNGLPITTLKSALERVMLRDAVFVYQTSSLGETSLFLERLIKRNGHLLVEDDSKSESYVDVGFKVKKKENITKEIAFAWMLTSVPGVSSTKAESIAKAFGTMKRLISAIEEHSRILEVADTPTKRRKALKFLSDIEVGGRKLGPKVSERIVAFLS